MANPSCEKLTRSWQGPLRWRCAVSTPCQLHKGEGEKLTRSWRGPLRWRCAASTPSQLHKGGWEVDLEMTAATPLEMWCVNSKSISWEGGCGVVSLDSHWLHLLKALQSGGASCLHTRLLVWRTQSEVGCGTARAFRTTGRLDRTSCS